MVSIPRLLIAAPASGQGKTTVAIGLMAALRGQGCEVAGFKVGPDYIDPGFHRLATGRPGRNLDAWLTGPELIAPLLVHGMRTPAPADLALIEGVMGLFDGMSGTDGFASSAHIATLTRTPVLLVIDASHSARTAAAVVHGLATFDPEVQVAGVIINKVGSVRHGDQVAAAVTELGLPVLGVLGRDPRLDLPERHLGLVPAAERQEAAATLELLAGAITEAVDLGAVRALADSAEDLDAEEWTPPARRVEGRPPRVAIAGGRAFTFRYAETTELIEAAGCEVVEFDPLSDPTLPPGSCGVYLGGGFPEVHAAALSANTSLRRQLAEGISAGLPVVAECAGLLYLCTELDGRPMVGALPLRARMTTGLTMGYRTAVAAADSLLGPAGMRVHGHEFHRTVTEPLEGADPVQAWRLTSAAFPELQGTEGVAGPSLHASYLHLNWAGHPELAAGFTDAVRQWAEAHPEGAAGPQPTGPAQPAAQPTGPAQPDPLGQPVEALDRAALRHHGDAELAPGLVDLAVNVRATRPPRAVLDAVLRTAGDWGGYPDPGPARAAIAARHRLGVEQVLPTAGSAEAFTLIARALPQARRAVIVHPQFTEPEAALRTAGAQVHRHLLQAGAGFTLTESDLAELAAHPATLLVIGNPTNPTSVLHPAAAIRRLLRPDRLVVVDEAFMDAVDPDQSLIGPDMSGLVVTRSLTKSWGLAGLRAGYLVAAPETLTLLAEQQPPWAVSTPALAAIEACLALPASEHLHPLNRLTSTRLAHLVGVLRAVGLQVLEPAGPFVLVDSSPVSARLGAPGAARPALVRRGFAVRRGETFPGLGPDWIRIACCEPATADALADTLADLLTGREPEETR